METKSDIIREPHELGPQVQLEFHPSFRTVEFRKNVLQFVEKQASPWHERKWSISERNLWVFSGHDKTSQEGTITINLSQLADNFCSRYDHESQNPFFSAFFKPNAHVFLSYTNIPAGFLPVEQNQPYAVQAVPDDCKLLSGVSAEWREGNGLMNVDTGQGYPNGYFDNLHLKVTSTTSERKLSSVTFCWLCLVPGTILTIRGG